MPTTRTSVLQGQEHVSIETRSGGWLLLKGASSVLQGREHVSQPWTPETIRDAHHLARQGYAPAFIALAIGMDAARVARLLGVA